MSPVCWLWQTVVGLSSVLEEFDVVVFATAFPQNMRVQFRSCKNHLDVNT